MIWSDLLCGLNLKTNKQSTLGEDKLETKCVFCNPTPDRFDIVLQDDRFVVFRDRSPAALHHLLAIPRRHIANVQSLSGSQGAEIVRDLHLIGQKALSLVMRKGQESNEHRYGFHIPPFRSVEHLHLHCQILPFASLVKAWKYRVADGNPNSIPPTSKGWGWFVTASQAIQILQGGGKVKVQAC